MVAEVSQISSLPEMTVTHPPPAALPEVVSEAPSESALWLDGYWRWEGDEWVWVRGGWVREEPDLLLVRARFWYGEKGVLKFSDRAWINSTGELREQPEVLRPAATPPSPRLPESSTLP